ncbi:MAG: Fic family protein [Myxococcota bacterium]
MTVVSGKSPSHGYIPPAPTGLPAQQPKPEEKKEPQNLGEYLKANNKTVEDLQKDSWSMQSAARALLKAKGVDSPTESELTETTFQLSNSIKSGQWQAFVAPIQPKALKLEDGVGERKGNVFFEKQTFSARDLEPANLKLSSYELPKAKGDYESGRVGMMIAATFINTPNRAEGDFTRAYGDVAWRGYMRAHTMLENIPKGKLLDEFSVDLMVKANEAIHAPDEGIKATLLRGIAWIGRGFRWDKGGEIRDGRQYARPSTYTNDEVKNMQALGIKFVELPGSKNDARYGMLEYPKPDVIKQKMQEMVDELKTELKKPDADVIGAAAKFQQRFVALHPFGDSNGRTGRVLMNRILSEYDFPPAILRDQDRDLSLSHEQFKREVSEGIARAKKFIGSDRVRAGFDDYMVSNGLKVLEKSPDKPVLLNGLPFDLGRDGFLYDPAGRPSLVMGGKAVPFSQLEYFTLSRRLMMMPKEEGQKLLSELTKDTVALHGKVATEPKAGEKFVVEPDLEARKADGNYKLSPHPQVAELLVKLADVSKMDKTTLFTVSGAKGSDATSAMSKYQQVDLEFWYLEQGLRDTGRKDLAAKVHEQRGKLFDLAKEQLKAKADPTRVSTENPYGFKVRYEQMMYETSPLRFKSLDDAIKNDGDGKITVWRGDYSFAKLIGMAPNNDVRQKDAKAVAKERSENGTVGLLYDELMKLEGSAVGRQYICTTSDLSLLSKSFADSKKSQVVNLQHIPAFIADRILTWLDPEKGAEAAKAEKAAADAAKPADAAATSSTSGEKKDPGVTEIKDRFGVPGTLMQLKIQEKSQKKVEVTAHRKAFELRLDKDALLPGIVTLGKHHFAAEQEMHGLERVYPWHIKNAHSAEDLNKELPVTKPAQQPAATGTTTPAPTTGNAAAPAPVG